MAKPVAKQLGWLGAFIWDSQTVDLGIKLIKKNKIIHPQVTCFKLLGDCTARLDSYHVQTEWYRSLSLSLWKYPINVQRRGVGFQAEVSFEKAVVSRSRLFTHCHYGERELVQKVAERAHKEGYYDIMSSEGYYDNSFV